MDRMSKATTAGALSLALFMAACGGGAGGGSGGGAYGAGGAGAGGSSSGPAATGSSGSSGGGHGSGYGSGYGSGGGATGSSGSGGSSGAGASVLTVTQVNYQFTPAKITVTKGDTITISDTNPGTPHTFTIAGTDIDVSNNPHQSQDVTIDLRPGTYTFFCRFHVSQGMKGTLTVE